MDAPKKNKSKPKATIQNFPIVGVGASAGGLDAFKRLLQAIPEKSGMAYVLVQHLDPTHESVLPEILQRVTKIPVHEITDDIHLAPDNIYIIPSNKILTSTNGVLQLTPRDQKINLSIDIFFKTLAEVHKEFAVGVVLSGTGSDGTQGLKAIKEHGGISIVQDSESATFDGMPQSALNADVVDFVLAPEKIPAHLLNINNTYELNHFFKDELPKDDEGIFKQILLLLHQRSGVDFTYYKQPTFHRRIARRIAIAKKKNLADYLKFLRTNKAEQDALFQDVLIPVTSFFRDPKTFKTLIETVFPSILKNKNPESPIRIWIAGCSTGEEAFSIAICLHEFLGEKLLHTKIQIFASDISDKVIKKARSAIYTKADVEKMSVSQLKNYFVKNNDGYEVSKLIRDICVFAPHNFLKDPPFAKMDLITCRNVLIYMDAFLQKKALNTFHYALKENGFLLLGKSETTGSTSDLFTQVSKNEKIYLRKSIPGRFMNFATEPVVFVGKSRQNEEAKEEIVHTDFRKSAEEIMISKSPASVVVNKQMDIVHIHGDITPFLIVPQGKPTHNLLKMAREGLAFELRNAINKASKEKVTVVKENILIKQNDHLPESSGLSEQNDLSRNKEVKHGKNFLITVEIIPLQDINEPYLLIRFVKKITQLVEDENKSSSQKYTASQNQKLEKELLQTREDMGAITEDMEAFNEELQSANEELQSSNEEMQSLNEELETSKEELQSTNEELIIVNQELIDKQELLNELYSEQLEAQIRVEASEKEQKKIASQLKLATDSAKVGIWSLNIVSSKLEWSNIHKKMWGYNEHQENLTFEHWHKVIVPDDKKLTFQRVEESKINHSIYEADYRIHRANDGTIAWIKSIGQYYYDEFGIAHTLTGISIDITDQKISEEQIRQSEEMFKSIFENSLTAILVTDDQGNYSSVNNAACKLLGYTVDELLKMNVGDLKTTAKPGTLKRFKEYIKKGEETGEFDFITKDGSQKFGQYQSRRIKADFNLCIMMDITDQKASDENIKTIATELASKNKLIEESEKRFKTLSDNLPHMIWSATADGNKNFFNKYFLEYTGLSSEELQGDGWHKMIFPGDIETELKGWKLSLEKGENFKSEKRIRRHDGTYHWHLSQSIGQKDKNGNIISWIGTNTEIEEQKLYSDALVKGEEQFRTFANSIQNLAWIADSEGWIYWYNQRWYDYTGTTLEEMEGWGWQKVHHPDHVEKITELSKVLWKKDEAFELTFPLRRHDGVYRWFLTVAYPVKGTDGKIDRWIGTNTDITQQKDFTEELESKVKERTAELSERNIFIETLIDSSIDTIIAFDKDLRYISMNIAAKQILEKHFPKGVIGKKMDDVIPHARKSGAYNNALLALQGNIISQKEYKSFYENKYFDVDYVPLRNETEIYGVMTISRDVTENVLAAIAIKKANLELEERKNLVETILETSKEYIAVYAKDLTLLTINKATEMFMGMKREDVIGKTLLELIPQSKGTREELDLKSALEGNNVHNEAYQSSVTGRYIENYINPLKDTEGNVYAAVAMANDVTNIISKQKEVEAAREILQIQNETFELAESIAKFGSYSWNITSGKLKYSDSLFRLLDCEPDEFVPSIEKFLTFVHPNDLQEVTNNGDETVKTGILVETPYRIISKTGQIKYFRSSGKYTGEGDNTVLIGTVQDISKDISASKELEAKNRELENVNSELASFSYVASHDLQEPLRKIQGFSKRILEIEGDKLSETTQDYFNRINSAALRMQNLITSLLSFSSMGVTEVVFEKTNLNTTLKEVINVLNETITNKNAIIESENLPTLNLITVQMQQLFLNLISNAIKYAKPDIAPHIIITAEKITNLEVPGKEDQKGKYWKIEISDNGIGFEQQYEHKIFEVFQRLHGKTEYEGTGVGLAICKKIVQSHQGIITAKGQLGIGATFTVYLQELNK